MINVVIPLAGEGSRFKEVYKLPKPLIPVNKVPMITRAIESLGIIGHYHFVVKDNEYLSDAVKAIASVCNNPNIITVKETTKGAACSALLLKEFINNDDELVIANCDQIMNWDSYAALSYMRNYDGVVVVFESRDIKHSYVRLENGFAKEFAEKNVISNNALTGIHYWKHGKYFVDSATKLIESNNTTNNEFYVSATYNYLVDKLKIGTYKVSTSEFHPIGTPYDLEKYRYDTWKII
jgi:NDP-sugar pyrophosphorylase family protein